MDSCAYGPPSDYYIPTNVLSIPISSSIAKIPATGPLMPQQQAQDQDQHFNDLASQQLQSELNAYIADLPPQRLVSSLDQASKPLQPPPTQKRASIPPVQPPRPRRNDGIAVNYASKPNLGSGGSGVGIQAPGSSPKPHSDIPISINPTTKTALPTSPPPSKPKVSIPRALLIASLELETCIHPQPLENPNPNPNPNTEASKAEFDFHADYVAFDKSDREGGNNEEDIEREGFARLPRRLRYGDKDVRRAAGLRR